MKPKFRRAITLASFLSVVVCATTANAANLYWDSNGTTDGAGDTPTGTWGADNFWNTDSTGGAGGAFQTATLSTDDLFFSAGTDAVNTYTVGLNSTTQNARLVTFEDGTATLNTGTLSLGNLGGITVTTGTVTGATISSDLTLNGAQTFDVAASRTLTLDTGTFTRNAGATLNVLTTGTVTTTMTGLNSASLVNGTIGAWASHGSGASTRYATIDGSNNIVGLIGTAAATAANVTNTGGTFNYDMAGGNATFGAGANINTLRYTGGGGTVGGGLTTSGIMNVGGGGLTLSGTMIGTGGLVVNTANGGVTFGSILTSATPSLVKAGPGRLATHNAATTFTGPVTVNGGVLQYGDLIDWLTTGNITLNGGVMEQRWTQSITKAQGTAAGQIRIVGGESGFSENGNTGLTWNIGAVTWGSATFNPSKFVLQTSASQLGSSVTFSSAINLNGANRTVVANAGSSGTATSTLSGAITNSTGTAGLIKEGPGNLILSTTNTYNGNTTVSAGILTATTTGGLPGFATAGRVIVSGGATLAVRTGAWTAANIDSLRGAATWSATTSQLGFDTTAANFTYANNITEALTVNKLGNNTLTLSGNSTYTGGTVLSAGTLSVGSATAIPSTGTISFNGGTIQSSDATLRTLSNAIAVNSNITVGTTGNLTFSNTGATALGATRTFTIGGGNTTFAQAFSGSGAGITKAGAGTLTLTGANTYTGATTISAGTVVLNNDGDVTSSAVAFNGSNSGLTITGGSTVTSIWNNNGGAFGGSNSTSSNNVQVLIDGAGTAGSARLTNVTNLNWGGQFGGTGNSLTSSTLSLTNGGQMTVSGEVRTGSTYYATGGGANISIGGGSATSTFTGNSGQAFYIGFGDREGANNNVVTVSSGGVLTSVGNMFVGNVNNQQGNDLAATANKLTVTGTGTAGMVSVTVGYAQAAGPSLALAEKADANVVEILSGGTLTTSGVNYIGRANANFTQANANTMTVTGTGSSWAAGNQNVLVGFTNNAGAVSNNNILTVGSGGTVTGVAALTVGSGTGTETGNQLVVNGSLTATSVSISASNSLSGIGTITGPVTVNGTLSPGNAGIGTVTTVGNLSFGSTGIYSVGVDATSVTSDQTSVTGTVAINAATTLSASVSGTLASSQKFFIVVNDGVDAVTGTFSGFAQDAVVGTFSGTDLKISYVGDSVGGTTTGGNDIVLYVDGGGDVTPPTLTSIADNVTGGPININAPVTYTVTFNEDMDASTVTAADFSNAGTATASIGTITEITPGVFTVVVTPSTSGTLRLQIPITAVLTDVAGNPLDNDPALLDDTTITVRTIYDTWAIANGATGGPGGNTDGDSLTNLQEFAFGTDPTTSTGVIGYSGGTVTQRGIPKIVSSGGLYYMAFGRRADYVAAGLTYTVEFTAGLDFWEDNNDTNNPPVQVATDSTINALEVPFVDFITTPSGTKKPTFARVKVELAP